jgi:GNAT superfamily N-acetyltransferase
MAAEVHRDLRVRELSALDLPEVVRIAAAHTGREQTGYWRRVFESFCGPDAAQGGVGLCVDGTRGLAGYLFGEVREVEFGSEPCGWVFAVGVDPGAVRHGSATALLREAARHFAALGVTRLRTMVARNDVPLLSFFRASGFVGGPFVQLELQVEGAVLAQHHARREAGGLQ